uniref:Uncharacterized protein n=1 Tax=Anguilla anguilla TaxID=7936 RepID=A0A0E9X2X5_ANGAN
MLFAVLSDLWGCAHPFCRSCCVFISPCSLIIQISRFLPVGDRLWFTKTPLPPK